MVEAAEATVGLERFALAGPRLGLTLLAGLTLANCAQQPGGSRAYTSQERREIGAFSQARYGAASPRVVADGEAVPKGGGIDLVGRPYSVAGRRYAPYEKRPGHTEIGGASWYGVAFHGRRTANGEVFDRQSISAAHKTMPLPSYARVANLINGRSIVVRVNDRGPYHGGRIIDVSQRVAEALDFRSSGTGRVKVEYLGRASLAGSDDRKLFATLRTDGTAAPIDGIGGQSRIMFASLEEGGQSYREPAAAFAPFSGPMSERPEVAIRPEPQAPAVVTPSIASTPRQEVAAAVVTLPLPPERPFDLGTIPNASRPVMSAVPGVAQSTLMAQHPSGRDQAVATLFYAEPARITLRFARSDPWAALKPQSFRPLRVVAEAR